jgi:hypothetical protein
MTMPLARKIPMSAGRESEVNMISVRLVELR